MIRVLVDPAPVDMASELARLEQGQAGAVASFTGMVRSDDGVTALELEEYPGMTAAALTRLADEAVARWSLEGATIVHRVGRMVPGDRIVFVGTAARHRRAALDACAFLIDRLKTGAPFWKREQRGTDSRWVEARDADTAAAAAWGHPDP